MLRSLNFILRIMENYGRVLSKRATSDLHFHKFTWLRHGNGFEGVHVGMPQPAVSNPGETC